MLFTLNTATSQGEGKPWIEPLFKIDLMLYPVHGVIIILIMSRRQHGSPWPSLTTRPYRTSLPTISYIGTELLYIGFSWSYLPLFVYVKGSTEVCHL